MEMMLWNGVLSFVMAGILMWIKSVNDENKRLSILLSKTREENAEKYVTKMEVHADINRVLDRLDRLENKIDTFMREQRSALS
jgi:archaellum component FlaC